MVYKRYITKNGKKTGPYYYKSVRDANGKIKSVYVGQTNPENPLNNFTLHQKKEAIILTVLVILCFSAFLFVKPTITGYSVYENGTNETELNLTIAENITLNESIEINSTLNETIANNITLNETVSEPEINETVLIEELETNETKQTAQQAEDIILTSEKTEKAVLNSFDDATEVRVIVKLKNPPKPDFKNKASVKAAALSISQKQDAVLSKLDYSDERTEKTSATKEFKLTSKFESTNAFAGKVTKAGLAKLQKDSDVEEIILDMPVKAVLDTSIPILNVSGVWAKSINGVSITGKGQTVCVIDTGIQKNHPAFGSRVIAEKCYCADYCCPGGVVESSNATDDNGHGTHCAGIIASSDSTYKGVAYEANIVAVKVLDFNGSGYVSDTISAIDWCIANKDTYNISVISLSLGGGSFSSYCDSNLDAQAVNNAAAAGIFVSVATGNDQSISSINSPACASNATAVAATDDSDSVAIFSNTNSIIDVFAPGVDIISSWLGSTWVSKQGTSMATPHVAGAAALIKQYYFLYNNLTIKPKEIENILKAYGKNVTDARNSITRARINVLNSINQIYKLNSTENSISAANGKITFSSSTSLANATSAFLISDNYVWLNDSYAEFNKSASIILYNLTFTKMPVVYRNGVLCKSPVCNATSYLSKNFSFTVSGFSNYTAGANSQLEIFAGETNPCTRLIEGEQISFYANYTNITSNASVTTASCNITFYDYSALMDYNSTSYLYKFNRSFSSTGNYNYTINCSDSNFENLQASDNFTVLTSSPTCTIPPPNCEWNITGNNIVTCENENLLLQNQSLRILDNSTFRLINSNLTLDNASADQKILTAENTLLIINNTRISSLSAYYFDINISGDSLMHNSVFNMSRVYVNENKTHNFTNSIFYFSVNFGNGYNINRIDNCTFSDYAYFADNTTNNINNSLFSGTSSTFYGASNNTIENSNFSIIVWFQDNSYSIVRNCLFNDSGFGFTSGQRTVDFQLPKTTINKIYRFRIYNTTVKGFVDMPNNLTDVFQSGSKVFRYYPVYVNYSNGQPAANKTVNVTSNGILLWSGATNATGWAEPNLTFNSTNYNDTYNLTINPTLNLSLFTDTPIIVTLDYSANTAPSIILNNPSNNEQINNTQTVDFNFSAADAENSTLSCLIYLDGILNQTNSTTQNSTLTAFTINGISYGQHSWHVNCTDGELSNISETWNFSINDTLPPYYSNIIVTPSSPSVFASRNYEFNITWQDNVQVDNVLFEFDGINYTPTQSGSIYSFVVSNISVGIYNYVWYANDTSNNKNQTEQFVYTITKASAACTLNFNENNVDNYSSNYSKGVNVNCSCTNPETTATLFREGELIASNSVQNLSAGNYNYVCNSSATANYFYSADSGNLTVSKLILVLALNALPSWTISYGTTSNVSCSADNQQSVSIIYRNSTGVSNPEITSLGAGSYNYSCSAAESQNYTAASASNILQISKATAVLTINLSPISPVVYGTTVYYNCTSNNPEAEQQFYLNGNLILSGSSVLNASSYGFVCNSTETQNYTSATASQSYNVLKANTSCSLIFNLATPQTYGTLINASCSCNNPETTAQIFRNNADIDSENNNLVLLSGGTYNYICNASETANYNYAQDTEIYQINKAVPDLTLISLPLWNLTYGNETNVSCSTSIIQLNVVLMRNNSDVSNPNQELLAAGSYEYSCNTTENENYSSAETYETMNIAKALAAITLNVSAPLVYGDAINYSCSINNNQSVKLFYIDNVLTAEGSSVLSAGTHNFVCNASASQNYTSASANSAAGIAKANHTIHLALNGIEDDLNVAYGTEINATGWLEILQGIGLLYRNSTDVSNPEISILAAGIYGYDYNYSETQNYTLQEISRILTVNKSTAICDLTFDLTSPQEYGTNITPNCSCNSEVLPNLTVDNYFIPNLEPIILSTGNHSFNCSTTESENYTYAEDTDNFTIIAGAVDLPPSVALYNPPENSTVTETLVNFTYTAADDYNVLNCTLFINDAENETSYSVENGAYNYFAVNLTEGNYTWAVNCSDNSSNTARAESYFTINITYGTVSCTQSYPTCTVWSECISSHRSRTCTIYDYHDICNNTYTYTETVSCSGGGGGGGGGTGGGTNLTWPKENETEETATLSSIITEAIKETKDWIFQPVSKPKQETPQKCIACWIILCGDYWLVVVLLALIVMISYVLVKRNDIVGYAEERKEKKNGLEIKAQNKELNEDFIQWEIISLSLFLFAMPLIAYWLSNICWALLVLLVELIYIIYEFFRKDDFSKEIRENIDKTRENLVKNDFEESNKYYKRTVHYYHLSNEHVKNRLRIELDILNNEVFALAGKNVSNVSISHEYTKHTKEKK